jgi:hypothetical protein
MDNIKENNMATLSTVRASFENKVYTLMQELDPSGYNVKTYKEYFSSLTDGQLKTFCYFLYKKEDFNLFFEVGLLDKKNAPSLKKIKNIAEKRKVDLVEYVSFPYKRPDNPDDAPISTTKIPVIHAVIRPLQQLLDKKNNIVSNTDSTNSLTGQVTGDSKASSLSNMQTISLITSNQIKPVKEMLGPRSDEGPAKLKMLHMIENNGDYDLDDVPLHTQDKQATETMRVMFVAAGMRVSYGKNEKLSYILPM